MLWYASPTPPGNIQAPASPWIPTGSSGINYNTPSLSCNQGQPTNYWYQAIITDPNCICYPLNSQILQLEVDPNFPNLEIRGSYILCEGDKATLSLYNPHPSPLITNCPIEWWDITDQSNPKQLNGNSTTIQTGPLSADKECPYKTYTFEAKVCGICNDRTYNVYIVQNPQPTTIHADRDHICWGQATFLELDNDNLCGTIQWQEFPQVTGVQWVDCQNATQTPIYNTNRLIETTKYRIKFINDPCQPAYSNEVTVYVQNPIKATISDGPCNLAVICPNSVLNLAINTPTASWQGILMEIRSQIPVN